MNLKRILFLGGIVIVGTVVVSGLALLCTLYIPGLGDNSTQPEVCPPPAKLKPIPDIDAMAARMKKNQDVYQRTRDQVIAAYFKLRNGQTRPYDEEVKATLRLFAYLSVWDDYYGEGLWQQLKRHTDNLLREGDKQQSWGNEYLWQILYDVQQFHVVYYNVTNWSTHYASTEKNGLADAGEMIAFGQSDYPPLFKYACYCAVIRNLVSARTDSDTPELRDKFRPQLDQLVDLATQSYGQFITEGASNDFLFQQGRVLLDATKGDEDTLKSASIALDRAFLANNRDNPMGPALDGEFYVDYAWNARGSGVAGTVTGDGWRLMGERLAQARQILEPLYDKYPNEGMIPYTMMSVVLGEGRSRDEMELWFQRGIKADPDNFTLYMRKRWYLFPRWYGSDESVRQFGLECTASDNWSAKIPMIYVECLTDAASRNPSIYARPEIWEPLEKVYRGYLERYPDSIHYRSLFAISAVQGGHWDVANEQFNILGDEGDEGAFKEIDFAKMKKLAASRAGK